MYDRYVQSLKAKLAELESLLAPGKLQQQLEELARRPLTLVLAGLAVLAGGTFFGGPLQSAFSSAQRVQEAAVPATAQPAAGEENDTAVSRSLAALSSRLEEANLAGIRLSIVDGRILARGTMEPAQIKSWEELRAWYDASHDSRVLLESDVQPGKGGVSPDLRIAAVWAGEAPYLLTSGGVRYFVGSLLPDNWRVVAISRRTVTLRRNGEPYVIDLTGGDLAPSLPDG